MVVSVALARRIDDTSGAHCKCRECKLSVVNAWGSSKCEIEPATFPCRSPPRGVSSLDLDRRRKPRGPFFWTAEAWSGRTQAHHLPALDADPFSPSSQEGRNHHGTEKEPNQPERLDAPGNPHRHQRERKR